ncbi:MAG: M48 family metalloprotease [Ardenticatenales bacterium]|nr:M48 family metalloprotease [Ardenticatenales bacterium]
MSKQSPSLAGRAIIAILLTIGFYLLAVAVVLLLLYIPYGMAVYANRVDVRILLGCFAGAVAVLSAIWPRRDVFVPPGPALAEASQPTLFRNIRQVAALTDQAMPAEVYLVGDVNAFVAQRGGLLGLGSKRVMGLGLPLLQALSVAELDAVLAHEFAHYAGGDTRFGRWIYRLRHAVIRAAANTRESRILSAPFIGYARLFLRITNGISRQQEFAADALAATLVGSMPLQTGLKKINGAAPAFQAYWQAEVMPLLQLGYRPDLADGFARFMAGEQNNTAMTQAVNARLQQQVADPYDTHPALPERLAAVAHLAPGDQLNEQPAVTLLQELPRLEAAWFQFIFGAAQMSQLTPFSWDEIGARVLVPRWAGAIQPYGHLLQGLTIADLPRLRQQRNSFATIYRQRTNLGIAEKDWPALIHRFLGTVLAYILVQHGWQAHKNMGETPHLTSGDQVIQPFEFVAAVAQGQMSAQSWQESVTELGIGSLSLTGPIEATHVAELPVVATSPAPPEAGNQPDTAAPPASANIISLAMMFGLLYIGVVILTLGLSNAGTVMALAGLGWAALVLFLFRRSLARSGLVALLAGATGGALIGLALGYLLGTALAPIVGLLGGALVGVLVGSVLLAALGSVIMQVFISVPGAVNGQTARAAATIWLLAASAGAIFGMISFSSTYPRIFSPVAGPGHLGAFLGAVLGWYLSRRTVNARAGRGVQR